MALTVHPAKVTAVIKCANMQLLLATVLATLSTAAAATLLT